MSPPPLYALTPADITDLRVWRAKGGRIHDGDGPGGRGYPFIVCSPSDGTLYLHSNGYTVAGGLAPHVMCALLHNERIEPGWCDSASDPAIDPTEALRSPVERIAAKRQRDVNAAHARLAREERDEAARRRATQVHQRPADFATLTLDDLLDTL
jgi:hypothetical protein